MQIVLLAVFFFVSYGIKAETSSPIASASLWLAPTSKSNLEESSHQAIKETAKITKDKLSCVLNILKTALSEELATSQLQILEETTQEPHSSLNRILEDEMNKIDKESRDVQIVKSENQKAAEKAFYDKVVSKIASALSEPKNNTNNSEIPTMIPIFKPRQQMQKNSLTPNQVDYNPIPMTSPVQNSRAVSFIPEKIIQTNMSPVLNQPIFNIPCQRASDVLDMNIAVPKEVCSNANMKPNINPVVEQPKFSLETQIPAPVTMSVNCADSDDTVAMLFKPQNISLMQMYGNLLKKITITVLVPYHMSKLGSK